jgi:sucrose phosphorylase
VVAACLDRGGNISRIISRNHQDPDGFDVHQIRGTYYSLLDRDDDAYIAARAIQLFAPGVPQVYYVGLLAGENDQEAAARTGDGREINRHNFSAAEVDAAVRKGVVRRLMRLIELRNEHPAFNGNFQVLGSAPDVLRLGWLKGDQLCVLDVDFQSMRVRVTATDPRERRQAEEL